MKKADSWKRISSEPVADCRVFRVRRDHSVRDSDGKESDFFVIEAPDWVNIIAMTDEGEIVFIEQFRQGTEEMNLELPGGMIDEGEQPRQAAERELLEETGYASSDWRLLGPSRPNPAIQNNTIYHFLAVGCEKTAAPSFDEHECVVTRLIPETEVRDLIRDDKVSHSLVVAAFYYMEHQRSAVE